MIKMRIVMPVLLFGGRVCWGHLFHGFRRSRPVSLLFSDITIVVICIVVYNSFILILQKGRLCGTWFSNVSLVLEGPKSKVTFTVDKEIRELVFQLFKFPY